MAKKVRTDERMMEGGREAIGQWTKATSMRRPRSGVFEFQELRCLKRRRSMQWSAQVGSVGTLLEEKWDNLKVEEELETSAEDVMNGEVPAC